MINWGNYVVAAIIDTSLKSNWFHTIEVYFLHSHQVPSAARLRVRVLGKREAEICPSGPLEVLLSSDYSFR